MYQYITKPIVLRSKSASFGKSVGFALQKSRFRNVKAQLSVFNRIIFTKLMYMRVMLKYDESINKKSPQAVKNCVWTF